MATKNPKTKCPSCAAAFRFKPELAGKKVRCAQCQQTFPLPSEPGAAPAASKKGSTRKPQKETKSRPGTRRTARPKTGRTKAGADSERRGSGRRGAAGKRGRKKSSPLLFLIIGGVVLIGGLGGLIFALAKSSPPPPGAEAKAEKKKKKSPPQSPPVTASEAADKKAGEDLIAAMDKDMKAIKALASRGKDAVPLLAAFLDKESLVSLSAAQELAKLGADAFPEVEKRLDSGKASTREAAIICLGLMGATAAPARDKIEELAEDDPDEKVRKVAGEVLEKL